MKTFIGVFSLLFSLGLSKNFIFANPESEIRRAAVVDALGQVLRPKVQEFQENVRAISGACDSSEFITSVKKAFNSYHFLEAAKFGPLADDATGVDFHISPLLDGLSKCKTDIAVARSFRQGDSFEFDTDSHLTKGLAAIEYLAFDLDQEDACTPRTRERDRNLKAWIELSPQEKSTTRCSYIQKHLVPDLMIYVDRLAAEWIVSPVESDSQKLLNRLADGLYFLERTTKDRKLADPIGLREDGAGLIREFRFEHPSSLTWSLEALKNNLESFVSVFTANIDYRAEEKQGIYNLLALRGAESVAEKIYFPLVEAIDALDAHIQSGMIFKGLNDQGFQACSQDNKQGLCDVYIPVREVTSVFKSEFYSVLDLRKPQGLPDDGD